MKNIKIVREQKKLSQKQLAALLGISKSYLNQLEHGKRLPSVELLIKICKFFKLHPCFFLCEYLYNSFPVCEKCFVKERHELILYFNLIRSGKYELKIDISLDPIDSNSI